MFPTEMLSNKIEDPVWRTLLIAELDDTSTMGIATAGAMMRAVQLLEPLEVLDHMEALFELGRRLPNRTHDIVMHHHRSTTAFSVVASRLGLV